MRSRLLVTLLWLCFAAPVLGAQRGPGTYPVVRRDTTVPPAFVGYSFRGTSNGYATIIDIAPNSPAERAGLHLGDQILSIDGFEVITQRNQAHYRGPGVPAQLRVRRGNQIIRLVIVPAKRPTPTPRIVPARGAAP